MDLNEDLAEVSVSASKNPFEYTNPFDEPTTETVKQPLPDEIEIKVPEDFDPNEVKRKWRVDMEPVVQSNIVMGKEKWIQYLKRVNGTANKEVYKVYDHLASDIFNDCMKELMAKIDGDLDQYCEKLIYDEFQMN